MERQVIIMQTIVDFICNGATDFTPEVMIGLLVFTLTLECIGSIAYNVLKIGHR